MDGWSLRHLPHGWLWILHIPIAKAHPYRMDKKTSVTEFRFHNLGIACCNNIHVASGHSLVDPLVNGFSGVSFGHS